MSKAGMIDEYIKTKGSVTKEQLISQYPDIQWSYINSVLKTRLDKGIILYNGNKYTWIGNIGKRDSSCQLSISKQTHSTMKANDTFHLSFKYNNNPDYNPRISNQDNNQPKLLLSDQSLSNYSNLVKQTLNYGKETELIDRVLKKYPYHEDLDIIALKVALIDFTNTTQLSRAKSKISLNSIAEIIYHTDNIDERIKKGDRTLVSEMSKKCKNQYGYNPFSFMTKYCTYHNVAVYGKDDFSIFDNVLMNNLPKYVEGLSASKIDKWRQNCDYETYWSCIDGLLKDFKINSPNKRRALDYCIWYYYRAD